MALTITRGMFILSCLVMGVIWADYLVNLTIENASPDDPPLATATINLWRLAGAGFGCFSAAIVLFGIRFITQDIFERMFPAVIAIVLAMVSGYFLAKYIVTILPDEMKNVNIQLYLTSSLVLIFGYMGISLGLTRASNWESLVSAVKQQQIVYGNPKIVDTSVLIDGRISEILDAGFIDGTLIVPRFILHELQHIADSSDVLRRTKGRRGLDILNEMQHEDGPVPIEIIDDDPVDVREVDMKLLALAKQYKAKILTTDFNLNKVAQIEGIPVMNINTLANSLKPVALPDERLEVKIVKEGKEATQGVGYLDDGTMIVVDNGREHIGETLHVVVTSVLQTAAGRMIFTKLSSPHVEPHKAV
jgi:uncharacterized protein YacL